MEKQASLMNSWNLESAAAKLPDNKLKTAIIAWIKIFKAGGKMNYAGIIYRGNLQYILENVDKSGLIDEIESFLPLEY